MVNLPPVQKQLLKLAKEKGFLELKDFIQAYASPVTQKAAIERFVMLGYIQEGEIPNKFNYIGEKDE